MNCHENVAVPGDCLGTFTSGLSFNEQSFTIQSGGNICSDQNCGGGTGSSTERCCCSLSNGEVADTSSSVCTTIAGGQQFAVFTEDSAGGITCTLARSPDGPESFITCTNGAITGTFQETGPPYATLVLPNVIDIRCPVQQPFFPGNIICPELPPKLC